MVNLRNLIGAIKASTASIVFAVVILFTLIFVIRYTNINDSLMSSLFLGVCSSVVSTLLLLFINKYNDSCRVFKQIINSSISFLNEISITPKEYLHKDYVVYYNKYTNICVLSIGIYDKKDFRKINDALHDVVELICSNESKDDDIDLKITEAYNVIGKYV